MATTAPARGVGRGPKLAIGGGALLIVLAVVLARGGGYSGDPHATVLDATEATLELPIAADVDLEVDLGRLAELTREGSDVGLGLNLLTGRARFDGRVTLAPDTVVVDLQRDDVDALALRLDTDETALARLDPDGLPPLPFLGIAERLVPDLLSGEWVAVPVAGRVLPSPATVAGAVTDRADRLADLDADTWRETATVTHLGDDADGWRFRVVPGVPQADTDERDGVVPSDEPSFEVWVDDDRVSRLRIDAGPFLAAELAGVGVRGREGALLVDLRPTDADVPDRPDAGGLIDLDRLPSLPSLPSFDDLRDRIPFLGD